MTEVITPHCDARPISKLIKEKTDFRKKVHALWNINPSELVVAVLPSMHSADTYILRHSEFVSLKPDEWLIGETIECYFQVAKESMDLGKKVFLMNNNTTGVIMSGNRELMARQRLSKVNFENYEAIISFFNTGVHWKLLYLCAPSQKVFVVDPMGSDEMGDSTAAAKRFRDFQDAKERPRKRRLVEYHLAPKRDWSHQASRCLKLWGLCDADGRRHNEQFPGYSNIYRNKQQCQRNKKVVGRPVNQNS
ncbi:uncharacterized protein [Lepisosteus oculatus]|uniref:uncharacterized protein n=1 Tax=Lepisosteus oculatus TaxID=7918 RepID=UPI0035F50FE9